MTTDISGELPLIFIPPWPRSGASPLHRRRQRLTRKSFDAPEDVPKPTPRQVSRGKSGGAAACTAICPSAGRRWGGFSASDRVRSPLRLEEIPGVGYVSREHEKTATPAAGATIPTCCAPSFLLGTRLDSRRKEFYRRESR